MKNIFYLSILMIVASITIKSQPLYDSIQVFPGWNLIGSIATGPIDSVIYTIPPNIINSPFYKFNAGNQNAPAGYSISLSLVRMEGYWVKFASPGWLYFRYGIALWPNCGTVTYDGKIYPTIVIGEQCWLRKNLDVGTRINGSSNQTDNSVIEKYCYNDNPANCDIYGGLYQWDEAMQYVTTTGAQGICPNGWHLPSYADFVTLKAAVGDDGNKLKAVGQGSGSGAGTNTSGFSALLAGYRDQTSIFTGITTTAIFWSSQQNTSINAHSLSLNGGDSFIDHTLYNKTFGLSVRCVKND